ncbi:hypothetical protein [Streptococcus uberis]|uniref:hypothetical protein n=1 Tax=Streptococcus uberis TaxID=1349 RepID=UPI001939813B|nr:hypothetical protein [Streptococcus uberis]
MEKKKIIIILSVLLLIFAGLGTVYQIHTKQVAIKQEQKLESKTEKSLKKAKKSLKKEDVEKAEKNIAGISDNKIKEKFNKILTEIKQLIVIENQFQKLSSAKTISELTGLEKEIAKVTNETDKQLLTKRFSDLKNKVKSEETKAKANTKTETQANNQNVNTGQEAPAQPAQEAPATAQAPTQPAPAQPAPAAPAPSSGYVNDFSNRFGGNVDVVFQDGL